MPDFSLLPSTAQHALLAEALAASASASFIADADGRFVWINRAFSALSGYSDYEAIGHSLTILRAYPEQQTYFDTAWRTLHQGQVWHGEVVSQRKDGRRYVVDEVMTPLFGGDGRLCHVFAIQNDITSKKACHDRDHYLANHDALTGLPNRIRFMLLQQQAIEAACRDGALTATLFVDLDRFKPVNDRYGHAVGDQLLVAVADRLRAAVRHGDVVGRCGGDEFCVLLTSVPTHQVAAALAAKLVETIGRPFTVGGQTLQISASIGIAVYPTDGDDGHGLLHSADSAMFVAKRNGGNGARRATGASGAPVQRD